MREELSLNLSRAIELTGISVIHAHDFVPTVRPLVHHAVAREELCVFRWFSIDNKDVNKIVELSETAWRTFESGFETEVQGLFAEAHRDSKEGTMLLLTWYKGSDVWLNSRTLGGAARESFLERHALIREAIPIATSLQNLSSVEGSSQLPTNAHLVASPSTVAHQCGNSIRKNRLRSARSGAFEATRRANPSLIGLPQRPSRSRL